TPSFRLRTGANWSGAPSLDGTSFSLTLEQHAISLKLSARQFQSAGVDLVRAACKLQVLRLFAEERAARQSGLPMAIAMTLLRHWPRGWYIQYFGRNGSDRHFGYLGILVPGKLVQIDVESGGADFYRLDCALREIVGGLDF
ncbi:hypothetical protein ACQV9O_26840, partial [Ralstonia pseudosolanacearum]|uniref:hypothetical protein n=1 Tax=Ralstonia pseudosolanacearum TaxID=1310165 RepID=UPI003D27C621